MKMRCSLVLLIIATSLIIIGVVKQEYLIVFKKAINICLECIGVG